MFTAGQLLHPICEAQPAGADLTFSPELDAIAAARKFDDPSLDQGEWRTDIKEADWDFVVAQCTLLLAQKSKDLRLAVWLTEAAAKQYGSAGLAQGLLVLAGLFETFWEQGLFPASDQGDHEQRIGNLAWILTRVPQLLRDMAAPDDDGQCMAALRQLEQCADARLGPDSPGFAAARDAVDAVTRRTLAAPRQPQHPAGTPVQSAAMVSRKEALAQLRAVAEYFRRTEPHSPVSYFAEKAAAAGEQDLASFLRSVVKDPASMAHIEELLGLKPLN